MYSELSNVASTHKISLSLRNLSQYRFITATRDGRVTGERPSSVQSSGQCRQLWLPASAVLELLFVKMWGARLGVR